MPGDPHVVDETLDALEPTDVSPGDVVGIGIQTGNALRGYAIGQMARARDAWVVFGGIHATLFPDEAHDQGGAHAVVRGDGDVVWPRVVEDCLAGRPLAVYEGGRIDADRFASARWDLLPKGRYMWGSDGEGEGLFSRPREPGPHGRRSACPDGSSSARTKWVCRLILSEE